MNKLLVNTCILAALGIAGCGGETIEDLQAENLPVSAVSRIVFDPANGNLNIPNDLLMLPGDDGVFDFTLNIPVDDPSDFSDPQNALNTLDGWSTSYPFQLNIVVPDNVELDASTFASGIRIFEATLGLDLNDPTCQAIAIPSAGCKVGDELVFGQDFVATLADRDTINIVPLRPFKAAQGHMLVTTSALRDNSGKAVRSSSSWDLAMQDINTAPLASESQLQLQTLVNSYYTALETIGLTRSEVNYVQVFTTQSTNTVINAVKQTQIAEFAQRMALAPETAAAALPAISVTTIANSPNAMEKLGVIDANTIDGAIVQAIEATPALSALQTVIDMADFTSLTSCSGLLVAASGQFTTVTDQNFGEAANSGLDQLAQGVSAGVLQQAGPLCAATLFEANISLPYYSAVPTAENIMAPVNEFWEAACTSGIVLLGAQDMLGAATAGPNAQMCQQAGLNDVRLNGEKIDTKRNLTKFSPIPQMKGRNEGLEALDVQITVPNPTVASALGYSLEMPDAGWPIVMLVHGITSKKEDMLAISGALSLAGYATVAIDQPMHGSRGFDLSGNGIDDINATTVSATHYLNLASLPTARDNLRQSIADLLGLRLGLNAVIDATETNLVALNSKDVSLMGVSLGAINGGMFTSIANTPFSGALAPFSSMYQMQVVSLESPGGGIANFLLESPSFGPLIKGFLLSEASSDFQNMLSQTYGSTDVTEAELVQATLAFLAALDDEQSATVNAIFGQFAFAAQTTIDSGDPINYFETLVSNTPVHMLTVVGDGTSNNLPDQVIPVSTSIPLSGQLPLAALMQLDNVVSTAMSNEAINGLVKYSKGGHASSLSPLANAETTIEMQMQIATYIGNKGKVIQISNTDVIASND